MSYESYLKKVRLRSRPDGPPQLLYICNDKCNRRRRIEDLFFCQECGRFSCDQCSATEIDTFFCPNCLNSVLTSVAFQEQNRCQKCVDCPICFQTLTVVQSGLDFHFLCEFCQWNSKSVGILGVKPPNLLASLKKREEEIITASKFVELSTHFRDLQKDLKKDIQPDVGTVPRTKKHENPQEAIAAIEKELENKTMQFYKLPLEPAGNELAKPPHPSLIDDKFDVFLISTLEQRFSNPMTQPQTVDKLLPRRKHLATKNAYRCRSCMKYVVKPKVGAAHVSYDMRSVAVSVVPRITFSEIPIGTLKAGQTIKLVLFFANPVPTDVTVQLGEAKLQPNEFDGLVPQSTKFTFPTTPFVVSAFDEVEHEDFVQDDSKLNADDDPKIVAYRNLSKVGVFCTLTPVLLRSMCGLRFK